MGEIRNSWSSKIASGASGRGLLIGITLVVIGAVLVVQLSTNGGLSRSFRAPAAPGTQAAALEQLQNALAAEVRSRRELEDRIEALAEELALLRLDNGETNANPLAQRDPAPEASPSEENESTETEPDLTAAAEASSFDDGVLLAHDVDSREIARLHDRWARYELERESIANSALREGWFFTDRHRSEMAQLERVLREDLTDLDYDRYLYALGQPNRLVAGEVLRGSAASEAGLQRGDVILSYADVRVFNPGEILRASSQGDLGKSVPMEILRDGQRRTVYVRQGPLGVILEHSPGEPIGD
jgi:hypothetical protein